MFFLRQRDAKWAAAAKETAGRRADEFFWEFHVAATVFELAGRRADVRGLQAEKRLLEHELAISTSPAALELEARQLGLVKPGERLFIVKGIAAWERKHAATIRRGG